MKDICLNMTVKELIETCCNMGNGKVRIINSNNTNDRFYGEYSEIRESPIMRFKVLTWEFIPKKQTGAVEWDFVLEITVA